MDTPIYDKMIARWHGETPDEIKRYYEQNESESAPAAE